MLAIGLTCLFALISCSGEYAIIGGLLSVLFVFAGLAEVGRSFCEKSIKEDDDPH